MLLGESDKRKHAPDAVINKRSCRPFALSLCPGGTWYIAFNVPYIWDIALGVKHAPHHAHTSRTPPAPHASPHTSHTALVKAKPSPSMMLAGLGGGAEAQLPLWQLLRNLGVLLPLSLPSGREGSPGHSSGPSSHTCDKGTLIWHLVARVLIEGLGRSLLEAQGGAPGYGAAAAAALKNALVSRSKVASFEMLAAKTCEPGQGLCEGREVGRRVGGGAGCAVAPTLKAGATAEASPAWLRWGQVVLLYSWLLYTHPLTASPPP